MALQDLREFLDRLERDGDLQRICVEVDPVLEVAAITDRVGKSPGGGPALLFESVRGSRFPVVTNLFGSDRRVSAALGVDDLSDLTRRMAELLQQAGVASREDAGRALAGSEVFASFHPVTVPRGVCQDVIEQTPDLGVFPILKSWPGDGQPSGGGRFITLPLVITRDPETGGANCGIYLVQVVSSGSALIRWRSGSGGERHLTQYRERRERMPVAIVVGGAPAAAFTAILPLPVEVDEMQFAGFLRGAPLEMVRCQTSDLMVPAHAELVIEGFVDPQETAEGGRFGNHTGYYVPTGELPVMHIACITRRRDPVFLATIVGRPPMEDCHMAKAGARLMLPFTQLDLPEVTDISLPQEGIFHRAAIVAIDKRSPGQGRDVMAALWTKGWLSGARLLIVVDRDVDVHDPSHVFWKVLNSTEWSRDLVVAPPERDNGRPVEGFPFGGRLGIDATRKLPDEGIAGNWPEEVEMDGATRELIGNRWHEYGFRE
jgi:4-hydroxy-3-polyprenylbenzoate decarboxylase